MKPQEPFRQHRHVLPPAHQRGHLWHLVLAVAVWALASLALFAFIVQRDLSRNEREFNDYSEALQAQLRDKLRANEAVLYGFASFLGARDSTDTAATTYAASVLERYPHIYQLEIVKRIESRDVAQFIAARRRAGHEDFTLREHGPDGEGRTAPAAPREVYYPVVFNTPTTPFSKEILGLDISARSAIIDSLLLSEREGVAVSSAAFRLLEGELGYIIFRPVISSSAGSSTEKGRYALLVVRAIDLAPPLASLLPTVRHSLLLHGNVATAGGEAALFEVAAEPADLLAKTLLPKLSFTRELDGFSQPLRLSLERQLRPADFDLGALALTAFASLLSALLLLAYLRSQGQLRNQIELLALYDNLTGLANRHLLLGHLRKALPLAQRRQTKIAVLFIDLDEFKPINDRFGHPAGDALLQAVSRRLQACIRDCDLAARLGGDEFVVVLSDIRNDSDAMQVAGKILKALSEPVIADGRSLPLSASIGIAVSPDDGSKAEDILEAADQAMYAAKSGGNGSLARSCPLDAAPPADATLNLAPESATA